MGGTIVDRDGLVCPSRFPGGSLYGLQESNPVATDVGTKGPSANYGKANDPMVGSKIGGLAL